MDKETWKEEALQLLDQNRTEMGLYGVAGMIQKVEGIPPDEAATFLVWTAHKPLEWVALAIMGMYTYTRHDVSSVLYPLLSHADVPYKVGQLLTAVCPNRDLDEIYHVIDRVRGLEDDLNEVFWGWLEWGQSIPDIVAYALTRPIEHEQIVRFMIEHMRRKGGTQKLKDLRAKMVEANVSLRTQMEFFATYLKIMDVEYNIQFTRNDEL